jgi:hypothetical protein
MALREATLILVALRELTHFFLRVLIRTLCIHREKYVSKYIVFGKDLNAPAFIAIRLSMVI